MAPSEASASKQSGHIGFFPLPSTDVPRFATIDGRGMRNPFSASAPFGAFAALFVVDALMPLRKRRACIVRARRCCLQNHLVADALLCGLEGVGDFDFAAARHAAFLKGVLHGDVALVRVGAHALEAKNPRVVEAAIKHEARNAATSGGCSGSKAMERNVIGLLLALSAQLLGGVGCIDRATRRLWCGNNPARPRPRRQRCPQGFLEQADGCRFAHR